MTTQILGKIGEQYAEQYLVAKGYQIIEKNFYTRFGEIDLIAIEPAAARSHAPTLAFIEVKTRTSTHFGTPTNAITYSKKQKIIKTALYFLNSSTKKLPYIWRIDAIGIQLDRKHNLIEINHIKNIIDG